MSTKPTKLEMARVIIKALYGPRYTNHPSWEKSAQKKARNYSYEELESQYRKALPVLEMWNNGQLTLKEWGS